MLTDVLVVEPEDSISQMPKAMIGHNRETWQPPILAVCFHNLWYPVIILSVFQVTSLSVVSPTKIPFGILFSL